MLFLYNIFIRLYYAGIATSSLWNKKAAAWLSGRRNLFTELEKKISPADKIIWVHCSSAGEFEQGKPLIEAIKQEYPGYKVLLCFFYPSGFAGAQHYSHADYITYLPLDTRKNAALFLKKIKPELAIFVKYEFWYHHLAALAFHHTPILLVSARFRKNQLFFRSYGGFFRQMLFFYRHLFVQDEASHDLLLQQGISHASVSGDTRYDRVVKIAEQFESLPFIEEFLQDKKCIVAGSTWKQDEITLNELWRNPPPGFKLLIAPHEIHPSHIAELKRLFPLAITYSTLTHKMDHQADVLIVDNVGMLSRLYRYATLTFVGGGFTKDGIHNILEAAVWGKPVIFGPNHHKYREAQELMNAGGGFSISHANELTEIISQLLTNEQQLQIVSNKAKNYVHGNTGATEKVIEFLQKKRLLTRL